MASIGFNAVTKGLNPQNVITPPQPKRPSKPLSQPFGAAGGSAGSVGGFGPQPSNSGFSYGRGGSAAFTDNMVRPQQGGGLGSVANAYNNQLSSSNAGSLANAYNQIGGGSFGNDDYFRRLQDAQQRLGGGQGGWNVGPGLQAPSGYQGTTGPVNRLLPQAGGGYGAVPWNGQPQQGVWQESPGFQAPSGGDYPIQPPRLPNVPGTPYQSPNYAPTLQSTPATYSPWNKPPQPQYQGTTGPVHRLPGYNPNLRY